MENFYVYSHTFLNEKNPFYIGIGSSKKHCRAFSIKNRNKIWNRVVNKYGEYKVDILHDGINKDDACSIEKELIKKYGRICDKSGILTNISIGGDIASLGVIFSEEHRNKISESNKGRKISEETRLKMKLAKSGKKLTEEHKLKLSKVRIGLKLSDDSKKKISIGNFGNKKCLGRKMTEDNKIKLSKANRIKVMCLNNGIVYNSALLAAKDLGISDKHIGSVCRGNRPHTCNYKFKHILE